MTKLSSYLRAAIRAPLLACIGLVAAVFTSAPALAETSFRPYPYGAPGDAGTTEHCLEGSYVVGVQASTGAWVNKLGLVCARLSADGRQFGADSSLPEFGSRPGGDADHVYRCHPDEVVTGFFVIATESTKQVVALILSCSTISGLATVRHPAGPEGVGARHLPGNDQQCKPGEAAYALAFRYGQDVNALGLVCRALAAVAPDPHAGYGVPPPPPVMSNATAPIKQTGRPSTPPVMSNAGAPIKQTGRPSTPAPPPAPAVPNLPPKSTSPAVSSLPGYAGIWSVTTVQNAQYEMVLRVDGDVLTGEFKNLQNDIYSGTLTGKLVTDRASISWIQPRNLDSAGQPSQGTGTIKVHTDNTLGGGITYQAPGAAQASYYRWYGTLVRALPVVKHPASPAPDPGANPGASPPRAP